MNLTPALVELVVADMAASLAFYRRLGLDIPAEADSEPHVDAAFGSLRIAFDTYATIQSFDRSWTPPVAGGQRIGLAFQAETPAEVDAAYAELVAAGVTGSLEPWDAFWGMRYAQVEDPDGNPVDLFAWLPS